MRGIVGDVLLLGLLAVAGFVVFKQLAKPQVQGGAGYGYTGTGGTGESNKYDVQSELIGMFGGIGSSLIEALTDDDDDGGSNRTDDTTSFGDDWAAVGNALPEF